MVLDITEIEYLIVLELSAVEYIVFFKKKNNVILDITEIKYFIVSHCFFLLKKKQGTRLH